jgi:hypothetical protein
VCMKELQCVMTQRSLEEARVHEEIQVCDAMINRRKLTDRLSCDMLRKKAYEEQCQEELQCTHVRAQSLA